MKIRRRPLTLTAWHNSKGPTPAGRPAEPMPQWLKKTAEPSAAPGATFVIFDAIGDARKLIHAESIVYQAVDGSIHAITLKRFGQEYEIADIHAKVPDKAPEDPVPPPEKTV